MSKVQIIKGDNLEVMRRLEKESTALVYMDPPFFTQRDHMTTTGETAFSDKWKSLGEFIGTISERAVAARELLKPNGCLVVHVDTKTSHYIKVAMDSVFGIDCFASEIIWRYRRWPTKTPNFQRVHDVLLRYTKSSTQKPIYNQLFEPLAASTKNARGNKKQRAVFNEKGHRCCSVTTDEESPGVPLGDVWDIGILAPASKERTGYPTQKPEALLERLILALTNPGDLVVDPYMGSGTTLAAAVKLGRRAIGIDIGNESLLIATQRLAAHL